MAKLSLQEVERALMHVAADLRALQEQFESFKKTTEARLDLRHDLTQQNAMAIQVLSTRMDMGGLPK